MRFHCELSRSVSFFRRVWFSRTESKNSCFLLFHYAIEASETQRLHNESPSLSSRSSPATLIIPCTQFKYAFIRRAFCLLRFLFASCVCFGAWLLFYVIGVHVLSGKCSFIRSIDFDVKQKRVSLLLCV